MIKVKDFQAMMIMARDVVMAPAIVDCVFSTSYSTVYRSFVPSIALVVTAAAVTAMLNIIVVESAAKSKDGKSSTSCSDDEDDERATDAGDECDKDVIPTTTLANIPYDRICGDVIVLVLEANCAYRMAQVELIALAAQYILLDEMKKATMTESSEMPAEKEASIVSGEQVLLIFVKSWI